MRRGKLHVGAAGFLAGLSLLALSATPGGAQTFRWTYVTQTANTAPLAAQSTVVLTHSAVQLTYTMALEHHDFVIQSCHATLSDVQGASTVHTQGRVYLFVQLKPERAAACKTGQLRAVALPTNDERYIGEVVDAINRVCATSTSVAQSTSKPASGGRPSASPSATAKHLALAASPAAGAESGPLPSPRLIKRGSSRLAIGQTGTALIRVRVGENGMPQEATIVSLTNRRLAAAAIETAVSSTYAPAIVKGKPITANYIATFSFDGADPALAGIPVWKRSPQPTPSVDASPGAEALPSAAPIPGAAIPGPSASPELPAPPTPPAPLPASTDIPAATAPSATPLATPSPQPASSPTP